MATKLAPTKTSKTDSDIEYIHLGSPKQGTTYYFEFDTDSKQTITTPNKKISKRAIFDVNCQKIRDGKLPLDPETGANPREPSTSGSKSDVVKAMQDTLTSEPTMFIVNNGGITIICNDFTVKKSGSKYVVRVEYNKFEGIVNGGHTYFSIENIPLSTKISDASVSIELMSIESSVKGAARKALIVEIANARNRNRAIDNKSSANSMGLFEKWKKILGAEKIHVQWKSNQSAYSKLGISAEEFIRTMTVFDIRQFRHNPSNLASYNLHLKVARAGPKTIHDEWYDNTNNKGDHLGHLIPMARDIMVLRDTILHDFTLPKWKGKTTPVRWPDKPNMIPTEFVNLWSTLFGNWLRKGTVSGGSVKKCQMHYISATEGINLPATLIALLLGQFRDCVWALRTKNAGSKIGLIGWYANPYEIWTDKGQDIIGSMVHVWNSFPDTVLFGKNPDSYKISPIQWAGKKNLKNVHEPEWFYDLSDKKYQKYVKEGTNPTHFIQINAHDGTFGSLVTGTPPKGTQGYKQV